MSSSQALCIFLIQQQFGPTLDLIESIPLILQIPAIVPDIKLDMPMLVEIRAMMDRCVFLVIADQQEV